MIPFEEWLAGCAQVAMESEWCTDADWRWRELYDKGLTVRQAVDELFKEVQNDVSLTMSDRVKARIDGAAAALGGSKLDANTYPENSDAHFDWLAGWLSVRLEKMKSLKKK